eukprot:4873615-Pleurochrysis_carterae.AAC.1
MVVTDTNGQFVFSFRPWIKDYPARKLDELSFAFRIFTVTKCPTQFGTLAAFPSGRRSKRNDRSGSPALG